MSDNFQFISSRLIGQQNSSEGLTEDEDIETKYSQRLEQMVDQEVNADTVEDCNGGLRKRVAKGLTRDVVPEVAVKPPVRTYSRLANRGKSSARVVLDQDTVKLLRQKAATDGSDKVTVKVFKCAVCSKVFAEQTALTAHKQSEHRMIKVLGKEPSSAKSNPIEHVVGQSADELLPQEDESIDEPEEEEHKNSWILKQHRPLDGQLQEAIVNMRDYFKAKNPLWSTLQIYQEISLATKVGLTMVTRVVRFFNKHGHVRPPRKRTWKKFCRYQCSDADREVIEKCIDQLKSENRLNSMADVYNELTKGSRFAVSFRGCTLPTFYRLVSKTGFRITETTIFNESPNALSAVSKECRVGGQWACLWPGCDKRFDVKHKLVDHNRVHTQHKPYSCRRPSCPYRCANYSNMLKHLKQVHKLGITKSVTIGCHQRVTT